MSDNNVNIGYSATLDPVALLGSLAPPTGWNQRTAVAGPGADQQAAHTLERVRSDNVTPFKRQRNGLRIVTSIVVAVSLGGAAVAAVLWERHPEVLTTVSCWSGPTNPPDAKVGIDWDGLGAPADRCTAAWAGGDLGADGPPEQLQACVTSAGVTAVMPGDETTCGALGLAQFVDAQSVPDADELFAIAELERRLVKEFNVGQCATPDEASTSATTAIAELGLAGWLVEVVDTFSADESCATVAVDRADDTVYIVPARPGD